jgi:hypothetical protein
VVHKITLRFGATDAKRRTMRDVARLTALPNAKSPVASLLGVMKDGRTVVFVVGDKVAASGNGACKPSVTDCRTVEMKADDAQYFHVPASGSRADRWYYLKVLHVDRRAASASAAKAAAARRSTPGMAAVRKAAKKVASYRYLPALGVLVRAKRAASGSSAAAGRAARSRSAVRQPGVPAWRSAAPAASR